MNAPQVLFFAAALLMLLDAVGYSLGAFAPLQRALAPADAYWSRRLRLNLLLANAGLYFTGLYTLIGALLARTQPNAAHLVLALSLLPSLYSAVTVPLLTPRDWLHALPRVIAFVLLLLGLVLG